MDNWGRCILILMFLIYTIAMLLWATAVYGQASSWDCLSHDPDGKSISWQPCWGGDITCDGTDPECDAVADALFAEPEQAPWWPPVPWPFSWLVAGIVGFILVGMWIDGAFGPPEFRRMPPR